MAKKKKDRFWKFYKIFMITISIIIVIVWGVLWTFLDSYESSTPENVTSKVLDRFNKKDYKYISNYVEIKNKEIYNKDDISKFIKKELVDNSYTFKKKVGEYNKDELAYSILDSNKKEVCTLYLIKKGKKGLYKMTLWEVEKIDNILPNQSKISVVTPENTVVYVNDKKISEEYIKDKKYIRESLSGLNDIIEMNYEYKYEIDDIYEGTEVYVLSNDNKYILSNNNNSYEYEYYSNDKILEENKDKLDYIVKNYTRYVTNEQGFGSLSSYVLSGSKAYSFLKTISTTNVWNGNHTPCVISDIKYNNMKVYNENVFSVDVSYSYYYSVNGKRKDFESEITLYMIKKNNDWYLANLTV